MTPEERGEQVALEWVDTQRELMNLQLHQAQCFALSAQRDFERAEKEKEAGVIVAERSIQQSANYVRPCIIHRPVLMGEIGQWTATYGELQAHGPTPELAYQEFDRIWLGKDEV